MHYKNTPFHLIIPKHSVHGGDISGDGVGESIFETKTFEDELGVHNVFEEPGVLAMASNIGNNANTSLFMITYKPEPSLSRRHVVFGRVQKGLPVTKLIQYSSHDEKTGHPIARIIISDCGVLYDGEHDGIADINATDHDVYPRYWQDDDRYKIVDERIKAAEAIRAIGNEFFKQGKYTEANEKYVKAFNYVSPELCTEEENKRLMKEEIAILGNLAMVKFKTKEYFPVIELCTKILSMEPTNTKAFYRRGLANIERADYNGAFSDLENADKLDPNNKEVTLALEKARRLKEKSYKM